MAEMSDTPNPLDGLVAEIRADLAAFRAQVDKDGPMMGGKAHPLIGEIRAHEALLAKIFKGSN